LDKLFVSNERVNDLCQATETEEKPSHNEEAKQKQFEAGKSNVNSSYLLLKMTACLCWGLVTPGSISGLSIQSSQRSCPLVFLPLWLIHKRQAVPLPLASSRSLHLPYTEDPFHQLIRRAAPRSNSPPVEWLNSQGGESRNYMQDIKDADPRCNITRKEKPEQEQECVRCAASCVCTSSSLTGDHSQALLCNPSTPMSISPYSSL
jgi:hypothetical protein